MRSSSRIGDTLDFTREFQPAVGLLPTNANTGVEMFIDPDIGTKLDDIKAACDALADELRIYREKHPDGE